MNIKDLADQAIEKIKNMSLKEFEDKLKELGCKPIRKTLKGK